MINNNSKDHPDNLMLKNKSSYCFIRNYWTTSNNINIFIITPNQIYVIAS